MIIEGNTYLIIRALTRLRYDDYISVLIRKLAISKDCILVRTIFVALSYNLVKLEVLLLSTVHLALKFV
jgi:hypothetical protein